MTDERYWRPQSAKAGSVLRSAGESGRLAGLGAKSLFLALLYWLLAACGSSLEQLDAADSITEAQMQITSPPLTLTVTPSPSPKATPSPLPTKTAVLTPTSEPLPTTCFDPELQAKVEADFLDAKGFASMQEALDELQSNPAYSPNISWGGFERGMNAWYLGLDLGILGSSRISLEGRSGGQAGDFALCLSTISPHYPDKQIPFVIGVERDGKWSQTTALRDVNLESGWIEVNSSEEAERWTQETRGHLLVSVVLLRFDKPDWERERSWFIGWDEILPELRREGGYVVKYSSDPSKLEALALPGAGSSSSLSGEFAEVDAVIDDMDLEHDIGLFAPQLTILIELTPSVTIETAPILTETLESISAPEGYLSPEKIQELASSFLCNDEGCVRDVYRYPNFLDFDFISSGVFQEIDLANPKTGELLGRGMVLKAVSKDRNDRPFVINILVQLEPVDKPGYNYLYGAAWTLIVAGSQEMDFVGEEILSADEWSRFIPEGATYEIALLKRRAPDSDRISSDPVTRDLYYLFLDNPNYLKMLKAFYESNGEEVDENLILFVSGSSDNTPKIVTIP